MKQSHYKIHRKNLAKFENQQVECVAKFVREGQKRLKSGFSSIGVITLLFRNVYEIHGKFFIDHVWIPWLQNFEEINLKPGDLVRFKAKICKYRKGLNYEIVGYGLRELSHIQKTKYITL